MNEHIDIIRPDWFSGQEVLAARVRRERGGIGVENVNGDWTEWLRRPMSDPASGEGLLRAEVDTDWFFKRLPEVLQSSYLYASSPHTEDECPFAEADRRPMRPVDTRLPQMHR
jgi:hypothetical protein